jgi:hypothetical protein
MARPRLQSQLARSPVLRYGLALLSVSVALGASLFLERFHFRDVADPLFLIAIAMTVWYAGTGPAIVAVVLSGLVDTYFFIEPIYSFYVTRDDLPHFVIFILFALLLTWFAAVPNEGSLYFAGNTSGRQIKHVGTAALGCPAEQSPAMTDPASAIATRGRSITSRFVVSVPCGA